MLLQDWPEEKLHRLLKSVTWTEVVRGFSNQALAAPNNRPHRAAKPPGYERSKKDTTSLANE
jgi:hypothetical protein